MALGLPGVTDEAISRVEFYRGEIDILGRFADVEIVKKPSALSADRQVVFTWWWSRSLPIIAAAKARGIPVVVTGATDIGNPVKLPWPMVVPKNILSRVAAQLADRNLAISNTEAARLRSWRYPNVFTVPLAVDTLFLGCGTSERVTNVLLTILHLNPKSVERKGLLRSLACLTHPGLTNTRLAVIGEDQGGMAIAAKRAAELGVESRVDFLGSLSRDQKRQWLWRATAYLQLSRYEGFGVAVVEAMSARCPVIVSPSGSLVEITGGLAFAYPSNTVELVTALTTLVRDPISAQSLAEEAARRVQSCYSLEARAKVLEETVRAVIG